MLLVPPGRVFWGWWMGEKPGEIGEGSSPGCRGVRGICRGGGRRLRGASGGGKREYETFGGGFGAWAWCCSGRHDRPAAAASLSPVERSDARSFTVGTDEVSEPRESRSTGCCALRYRWAKPERGYEKLATRCLGADWSGSGWQRVSGTPERLSSSGWFTNHIVVGDEPRLDGRKEIG